MTEKNPYEIFQKECPELAEGFNNLVEVQRLLKGLDQKTKQLINIAIQTSTKNSRGVKFHAIMAYQAGATKDEIIGAVVMNLHLTGLVTVLECLPAALEGVEEAAKANDKTVVSRSAAKKPKPVKKPAKH
ncbi:MAG: carboxymuconolactone decarboxylase family protein [Methanoregula sp.]|nr:carboxymuconolactone decarboxylase family protein [Methanoregula sp.]